MNRRNFLKTMAMGVLTAVSDCETVPMADNKKTNLLFILVDDLGWKDLGCYGSAFYETPNLDKLARTGMRFTDAYASCPVCSPTRASIMTGKYPARLGITDWIPGARPKNRKLIGPKILNQLPLNEKTMAEELKANGYRTFFAGKWHLGGQGYYPEDQGFDINIGGHEKGSPPGGYYSPFKNPKLTDSMTDEYLPDRLTRESINFMRKNSKENFMVFLSFYTVHTPIQACKRHLQRFKSKTVKHKKQKKEGGGFTKLTQDNAAYASMIYAMDENVGRLLNALKEMELEDNTVIIFTSDNGGLSTLKRRGYPTSNHPLRAGKGWCYEGGIRTPLLIRAPGITEPGSLCKTPVISMDFYPTVLDLAGIKLNKKQHMDGVSIYPLLTKKGEINRKTLFWHYPHYHGSAWKPGAAVRSGNWKLIEFHEDNRSELYNLIDDMGEQKELSKNNPKKKSELLKMLHDWQKNINAKFAFKNPNYKKRDE